jgi:hypothetical protein
VATGIFVKHSTVELMQSHTQVFRHSVTSDKNLWSQSISVNKNKTYLWSQSISVNKNKTYLWSQSISVNKNKT